MAHLLGGERLHLRYPTRATVEGIIAGGLERGRFGTHGTTRHAASFPSFAPRVPKGA